MFILSAPTPKSSLIQLDIASGNPVPSIAWTKTSGLGVSKSRLGEGPILTLDKVDRQHAGVYQCVAENHVGEPVSIDMRLDVLCEFEIFDLDIFPDIYIYIHWREHFGSFYQHQSSAVIVSRSSSADFDLSMFKYFRLSYIRF